MQGVKPVFPATQVAAQPVVELDERLRAQRVDPPLGVLADLDEARLTQHPQVAGDPFIGVSTAKTPTQRLYEKLGVSDRAAAVAEGMRRGLLE